MCVCNTGFSFFFFYTSTQNSQCLSVTYLLTVCRFSVRDFVYDEASILAGKKEAEDADTKKKKQFVSDACVVTAK